MLNYIWLSLISIGVIFALSKDITDLSKNTYENGKEVKAFIEGTERGSFEPNTSYNITLTLTPENYLSAYGGEHSFSNNVEVKAELVTGALGNEGALHILIEDSSPALWKSIFKAQRNSDFLLAKIKLDGPQSTGLVSFEPVKFVTLNQVTNDGIIKYAKVAVELAIGLIGIMALWLGIMKIAEQSGLVAKLASILKPVTTRLFPDVPADHPAMGAMIMNISANMLGLANAATPFGLKAMEELNKLNKKVGTATDAMCTFLVINTSSVQLIPATVIALRAAAGSTNPTDILGPVIFATTINTVIGITVVKLLSKLPVFKKQLEEEGGEG